MKFNRFHSIFSKLSLVLCLSLILSSMIYIPSVADPDPGPQWRVIWKNGDGTDLYDTGNISDAAYNELKDPTTSAPIYPGDVAPTKPSDAQYSYTFSGWKDLDPDDIVEVPGLTTITIFPSFNSSLRSYTVTFSNYNEETLQSSVYEYGSTPAYNGSLPERPSDDEYIYTFTGWDPSITAVSGDTTYTAVFSREAKNNPAPDPDPGPQWRVIWKNGDGTDLYDTGNISDTAYDELRDPTTSAPVYPGDVTPTKPSDAQYSYTFSGWKDLDPDDIVEVPGLTTITIFPSFNSSLRSYTVTFSNYNEETLQSSVYEYGSTPAYNGSLPERPSDDEYIYTFTGWDPSITAVSGDTTYTAVFSREAKNNPAPDPDPEPQWRVIWKNDDGTDLYDTGNISDAAYNELKDPTTHALLYPGDVAPTKPSNAKYNYTFSGWKDPSVDDTVEVSGLTTITVSPSFNESLRSYTITFNNYNGETLQSSAFEYGSTPTYNGSTPEKPSDDGYIYSFSGWSSSITAVSGDATYTAVFSRESRSVPMPDTMPDDTMPDVAPIPDPEPAPAYTITFVNYDTTTLQSFTVTSGRIPSYVGPTPIREADNFYTYKFAGWSPEFAGTYADTTYTAQYTAKKRLYTINFVDSDGNNLQTDTLGYDETPSYRGSTPTKKEDDKYTYEFFWSPAVSKVTGDTTYTVSFKKTEKKYKITFVNEDGTVLQSSDYKYGDTPKYTGQEPSKDETAEYIYEFANWSPNITQVTKDATYTAVFKSTDKLYTITFMGEQDGNEVVYTIKCKYGETPVYPDDENKLSTRDEEGNELNFNYWAPEILPVTGETVYHAVYKGKDGCYIATSVYGSYDTPEVWTLRRFRDGVLDKTWYGRAFIKTYYFISPKLIRIFGKNEAFHNYWEPRLSRFVDYLNNNGFEDTPYTDNSYEDSGSGVGILDMFRVIFGITLPF